MPVDLADVIDSYGDYEQVMNGVKCEGCRQADEKVAALVPGADFQDCRAQLLFSEVTRTCGHSEQL
jgi:hypothetical protein